MNGNSYTIIQYKKACEMFAKGKGIDDVCVKIKCSEIVASQMRRVWMQFIESKQSEDKKAEDKYAV